MVSATTSPAIAFVRSATTEDWHVNHVQSTGMVLTVRPPATMGSLPSRTVGWHVSVTLGMQAWTARSSAQEGPVTRATGMGLVTKVSMATAPVTVYQATCCLIVVWSARVGRPTPAPAMVIAAWSTGAAAAQTMIG